MAAASSAAVPSCPLSLVLRPAADLLDGDIAPPDFVVKPFFPRGELTEIVGAHGNFKSTIALDACLSIATGRRWGGHATVKGRTVFVTLEDSTFTLQRRVHAWLDGISDPLALHAAREDLRANFDFLAREDAQGLVLTATTNGATTARLDIAEEVARVTTGASLVVLETASRLHDGPETNDAFAAFIRSLEHIAQPGAAVVLVRHMSKKAAREMKSADTIDSYAGRGGGALSDAVRSCLVVTRQEGPRAAVTLVAAKTTHAKPGDTISWTPIIVPHVEAVRLELRSPEAQALNDAELLFAHVVDREEGITRKWLHSNPPTGVSRERAKKALDELVEQGRVVEVQERRGKNRQATSVYCPRPVALQVA